MAQSMKDLAGSGRAFDNTNLGDEVEVEYYPQDPAFSLTAIGSKRELFEDTVIISAIFSLVAASSSRLAH